MKIKSLTFRDHAILGNLHLNFCDSSGNIMDTIILAGANGTGKTTILNTLYHLFDTGNWDIYIQKKLLNNMDIEIQVSDDFLRTFLDDDDLDTTQYSGIVTIRFNNLAINSWSDLLMHIKKSNGESLSAGSSAVTLINEPMRAFFTSIYNDVKINFSPIELSSSTTLELDQEYNSKKFSSEDATIISQLFVDIQALDDQDLSAWVRDHPEKAPPDEVKSVRIQRFNRAFEYMFNNLKYDRISNIDHSKKVCFNNNGKTVYINDLSSGEKQIVFRGGFVLKDINIGKTPILFIDEPEISLHPDWQLKILDFYKKLVTSESGQQQSQIFVVTHSPFIIHNENRKNDKVIVLKRDSAGTIQVEDKPEYYQCSSREVVQDAFNVTLLDTEKPTVFLEGRTDEKYFKKALEVYGYENSKFDFKWIGCLDEKGQESNTGKDALNKALNYLKTHNNGVKKVLLFDCDTRKKEESINNVFVRAIPEYTSSKKIKKGIENALILDNIDLKPFYLVKKTQGDYGEEINIQEFKKMECCDFICKQEPKKLESVFVNLKEMIDKIEAL